MWLRGINRGYNKKIKKRTLSIILILQFVLSVFFIPTVSAEAASKQKVTVLTKSYIKEDSWDDVNQLRKYTYNKKGQIIRRDEAVQYTIYTYKKNRIVKAVWKTQKKGKIFGKDIYSYDKRGRLSKVVTYRNEGKDFIYYFKYNKKNQIVRCKVKLGKSVYDDFRFTWKNGRVTTVKELKQDKNTYKYEYDKKGRLTGNGTYYEYEGNEYWFKENYSYIFENNRPVRCNNTEISPDWPEGLHGAPIYYEYKTIKIDKKYKKQVQAQQMAIFNYMIENYIIIDNVLLYHIW